ncbi:sec-independent protein translocase protein TatC [Catenuloplanes nepalensis]|uniref:Sec-independent protein translocase protein TatC n=2 Tax=Catenuloplanes nepalensis TaxID=587533 RepID=A0ABT9MWT2_9ACTN|nr:sec-independent protein translocase protein TatC [Catenuloplanes nepalensis]
MRLALPRRNKGPSKFEQAANGEMTLIEHVRELRNRLFRASLAVLAGFVVGFWLADGVFDLLKQPYCDLPTMRQADGGCPMTQLGPADGFLLKLKIALWVGLIVSAPIWLYQLWAFIAPGLHKHERGYAYGFVALAAPLFTGGAVLAYYVVEKGLYFLLTSGVTGLDTQLEVTRYINFVTSLILLFGVAFLFPLVALMLNVVGLVSGKRLVSWWRIAVFAFFLFAAVVTPTPDPFGMTVLALALSALYFMAAGVAVLNDRRRGRGKSLYEGLDDDAVSPLDLGDSGSVTAGDRVTASEPVTAGAPVSASGPIEPVEPIKPRPIERGFDDMT